VCRGRHGDGCNLDGLCKSTREHRISMAHTSLS
jgi:hypothetical protein